MEIQPVVVGTAGHIDHGKSTLVRALTGIDPDRLKEERERGLTIDLGFANFELPDGRRVGIVDVPGHERFIRNMVAGASGIDLVVLVVAADDGVMPQTREHLAIMELLGVNRGFVALTKIDAVEPDLCDLAEEDVREFLRGTFLDGAPLLRISALEGHGMEELRAQLFEMAAAAPPRSSEGLFRMPIQRVFTKSGFGTVVTGIPLSGKIEVGDVLEVQPGEQRGKVRGLHAYGGTVTRGCAGHSTAVNIPDLDHHRVRRGDVLATPGFFRASRLIAIRFEALAELDRPISNRTPIRLHTGTADPPGELILLDVEELHSGGAALAQLRMDDPVVVAPGDRFVLRLLSPAVTLGGGVVLEESKYRLKRFRDFVIEELTTRESSLGSEADLAEACLRSAGRVLTTPAELAVALKCTPESAAARIEELRRVGRAVLAGKGGAAVHTEVLERSRDEVVATAEAWFSQQSHRSVMDVRELRAAHAWDAAFLEAVLENAQEAGDLVLESGGQVRMAGREAKLDPETRALVEKVSAALEATAFQPPTGDELEERLGAGAKEALQVLVDGGRVRRVGGGLAFAQGAVDRAREALIRNCENGGVLDMPALRDELGTTRKYLIPLLEHFDQCGVTLRQGTSRVLRRR